MGALRIVVDSSALIAIADNESDRDTFVIRIEDADEVLCSAVTLYETGVVLIYKKIEARGDHVTALVETLGLQVVPFAGEQVTIALDAYRRYGKGLGHRPHLNFGDCISYALAKSLDLPLLFKGNDFAATDIKSWL